MRRWLLIVAAFLVFPSIGYAASESTWVARELKTGAYFYTVDEYGSCFIAGGDGGSVALSYDNGLTWALDDWMGSDGDIVGLDAYTCSVGYAVNDAGESA